MYRVIKKYPNRRLYDTSISCYITFEEIKDLVLQHIKFKVLDARTEEDVTTQVLLQVINEQESSTKAPIFTAEILQNIIRFYNSPYQNMMSQYLEKSLNFFASQRENMQQRMTGFMATTPLNTIADFTTQQLSTWQSLFKSMFNARSDTPNPPPKKPAKSRPRSKKSDSIKSDL